jgi:hypothetical protein
MSRRGAIRTLAATTLGSASAGLLNSSTARAADDLTSESDRLKITIAGYKLDRVAGLIDGRVQVEGCDAGGWRYRCGVPRRLTKMFHRPPPIGRPPISRFEGIAPNRKALEALFQYSHEQGLASRRLKIEEVFHPSILDLVEAKT